MGTEAGYIPREEGAKDAELSISTHGVAFDKRGDIYFAKLAGRVFHFLQVPDFSR